MTAKAAQALRLVRAGRSDEVSWQMIRRLDRQRLIDFDGQQGWYVREGGDDEGLGHD